MSDRKGGGLLFGVIMGTILGVLFAPKKGKELRSELKKEFDEGGLGAETLKENFMEMGQDMADTAQHVYEKPEVKNTIDQGQKFVSKALKKAGKKLNIDESKLKKMGHHYYDEGRKKFDEAKDHLQEGIAMVKKHIMPKEAESTPKSTSTKKASSKAKSTKRRSSPKSAASKSPSSHKKKQ